jgi:hypothetical protein
MWDPEVVWTSKVVERGDLDQNQRNTIAKRNTFSSKSEAQDAVRTIEDRVFPTNTTTTTPGASGITGATGSSGPAGVLTTGPTASTVTTPSN